MSLISRSNTIIKKLNWTLGEMWRYNQWSKVSSVYLLRCTSVHLIVLQQYKAEVELWEGQLQVLYVSVFASFLLWQGKHRLPPPQAPPTGWALPLCIQRGLQLVLQRGESPLSLCQLLWKERVRHSKDRRDKIIRTHSLGEPLNRCYQLQVLPE